MSKSKGNTIAPDEVIAALRARTPCGSTSSSPARPRWRMEWSESGIEGAAPLPPAGLAAGGPARPGLRRGDPGAAAGRAARGGPGPAAQGAPDDRQGHRATSRAHPAQHGGGRAHGAGQRDLPRSRPSWPRGRDGPSLREALETLVLLLNPFTPHLCEEMWVRLGHARFCVAAGPGPPSTRRWPARTRSSWPCRSTARCAGGWWCRAGRSEETVRARAPRSSAWPSTWQGKEVAKCVVVPGRLVSVVVDEAPPPGARGSLAWAWLASGCGYALQGRGRRHRSLHQAHRRAAVQGPHGQGGARPAGHPGGDRGAAEARPVRRWCGTPRTSTPWSTAS